MKFRILALCAALGLGVATPAMAADMPAPQPAAPYDIWTGFFVGLHAGYGWGDSNTVNTSPPGPPSRVAVLDPDGFLGGVQAGYNWQNGSWVFGVVGDFSFAGMDAAYVNVPPPGPPFVATASINWLATLRARAGLLVSDQFLIYAHGGLALADIDGTWIGGPWLGVGGETASGYVIGAGVEYKFDETWSLFAEYSYVDLGDQVYLNAGGPANSFIQDTSLSVMKVGVNMRF